MAIPVWVQIRASQAVFLLILFQIPIFRSPCLIGSCETPVEVMLSQMAASMPIPHPVLQTLLLPGAMMTRNLRTSFRDQTPYEFPVWDTLVHQYRMDGLRGQGAEMNYRLEIMAGSYFVVGGAVFGLFKPGRMGLLGMMLIGWGLYREGAFASNDEVEIYPMFWSLLLCSFLSLRLKQGQIIGSRQSRGKHVVKRVHVA